MCSLYSNSSLRKRQDGKLPKELLHRSLSRRIKHFASLCKLHQEQKSVTNHCKKPILTPIKANQFLGYIQMDLIDFCNLPCECHLWHLWALHVVDYYTKFSWLFALKNKQTEEVAGTLTNFFWMFGFPSLLHSDNGKEFKSKTMSELCERHTIKQVQGAPCTPSTQGLVERKLTARSKRTF